MSIRPHWINIFIPKNKCTRFSFFFLFLSRWCWKNCHSSLCIASNILFRYVAAKSTWLSLIRFHCPQPNESWFVWLIDYDLWDSKFFFFFFLNETLLSYYLILLLWLQFLQVLFGDFIDYLFMLLPFHIVYIIYTQKNSLKMAKKLKKCWWK